MDFLDVIAIDSGMMGKRPIADIIRELKALNLSEYPTNDIYQLITEFGEFGTIQVQYHPNKVIMRARPINGDEKFTKISDLSYKPREYNTTYQRASIPYISMFYGCTISDKEGDQEIANNRATAAFESLSWLREKKTKGVRKIAFGKWRVTNTINLIAVVHKKDYYNANQYTKELVDGFNVFIEEHPEMKEDTLLITDFLAEEFGKSDINDQSDYLISAIFSDIATMNGLDGVLYPSVQIEGRGFNVAITPEAVDQKMILEVVGECIIYKNEERMVMDNLTNAVIEEGKESFVLLDVDPKIKAGEEICLKSIGVKQIDDIKY